MKTITDFTAGEDKLGLGQLAYGTLFTGGLWYDKDGTGVAAAVQVATLANMPTTLSASDFVLVAGS